MSPPPAWGRRQDSDGSRDGSGTRVSVTKGGLGAGRDIGIGIVGDNNTIHLSPDAASVSDVADFSGRLISECDPLDLEVHHAIKGRHRRPEAEPGEQQEARVSVSAALPMYVPRRHDAQLLKIVEACASGQSKMAVLVGGSSTGKTRACWEAVQSLAPRGWRLWHPFDPTRADAALEGLSRVGPRTVVWLNEAQHYLAAPQIGERIAAGLRTLLADADRGPVLVLGTLWPEYWDELTARLSGKEGAAHRQVRELLAGREIRVPDSFDSDDLMLLRASARWDERLAVAHAQASGGRIAQFLAGAPELLRRYQHAPVVPKAVLSAAMDARRLGCGVYLPRNFLEHAAAGYLNDEEFDAAGDDWLEKALAYSARPVHGNITPLRRVRTRPGHKAPDDGPVYRLADYLEQHGQHERREICPPESFWLAVHDHITAESDIRAAAQAAKGRWRLRHSRLLASKISTSEAAPTRSSLNPLDWLAARVAETEARLVREGGQAARPSVAPASPPNPTPLPLAPTQIQKVRDRAQEAIRNKRFAEAESIISKIGPEAFMFFTLLRELVQAMLAEELVEDTLRVVRSQCIREGSVEDPFLLVSALYHASQIRPRDGDGLLDEAERYALKAAENGRDVPLVFLVEELDAAGRTADAERLARSCPTASPLRRLAELHIQRQQYTEAEVYAELAVNRGSPITLSHLSRSAASRGDLTEAVRLAVLASDHGDAEALSKLSQFLEQIGLPRDAERVAVEATHRGDVDALARLGYIRERGGLHDEAERLVRLAATAGSRHALNVLAQMRLDSGLRADAERLALQAANRGVNAGQQAPAIWQALWPSGLEPDGTPTTPL
ncbi:tetratricopeptide repeat protein [Streptomyces sp. DH10]|uniref:tetratricopeptide repeat protein n=1 Tax=Streptomyces sp. DH10 TaxID=3040121 RepID=UPI0024415528|nr:transcriptional regulator [Streptomyces sp. DH10]MDG9709374.1 transcriptional regulator [Streptomyces sp. DH10]